MTSRMTLVTAAKDGNISVVKQLVEEGQPLNIRDNDGGSALYWACCRGFTDVTGFLLALHCDVNASVKWGTTPLMAAADNGHLVCVELLLSRNDVNMDAQSDRGDTAMHMAAFRGHLDIVRRLTDAGANPYVKNRFGVTPIQEAFTRGHLDTARFLETTRDSNFSSLPEMSDSERGPFSLGTTDTPSWPYLDMSKPNVYVNQTKISSNSNKAPISLTLNHDGTTDSLREPTQSDERWSEDISNNKSGQGSASMNLPPNILPFPPSDTAPQRERKQEPKTDGSVSEMSTHIVTKPNRCLNNLSAGVSRVQSVDWNLASNVIDDKCEQCREPSSSRSRKNSIKDSTSLSLPHLCWNLESPNRSHDSQYHSLLTSSVDVKCGQPCNISLSEPISGYYSNVDNTSSHLEQSHQHNGRRHIAPGTDCFASSFTTDGREPEYNVTHPPELPERTASRQARKHVTGELVPGVHLNRFVEELQLRAVLLEGQLAKSEQIRNKLQSHARNLNSRLEESQRRCNVFSAQSKALAEENRRLMGENSALKTANEQLIKALSHAAQS